MKKTKILIMLMILLSGIIILGTNVQAVTDDETTKDTQTGETTKETTEDTDTEDDSEPEDDTDSTELTWTDVSKLKYEVKESNTGSYELVINGLSSDSSYYLYAANGKAPSPALEDDKNPPEGFITTTTQNTKIDVSLSKFFELKGDTYITLVESQVKKSARYNKTIVSGKKIDRPALKPLGLRMSLKIASRTTTISLTDPIFETENGRKLKIKVGKITDNSILRSIQKGESGALSKLLTYGQNDSNPVFSGDHTIINEAGYQTLSTNNWKLVQNGYYYVYVIADDENGKYFPVSEVSLYQAIISDDGSAGLYDYLSADFKWNLEDDENNTKPEDKKPTEDKKDDTTMPGNTLPKTGQTIIMIVGTIGVVVIAVIFARKSKKYNV